jgi:hypothetical protein
MLPCIFRPVGTVVSDLPIAKEAPPGWVKGIDVRTGDTKWTFRTVPQADDFGADGGPRLVARNCEAELHSRCVVVGSQPTLIQATAGEF